MNPYVATAIAMCVIVILSLAGTAYLAMMFNRRAKEDLERALTPLAEAIDGEIDLDDARVSGRFDGDLVFGQMATGQGGIGRVFHVDRIDAAGGTAWEWSSLPSKDKSHPPTHRFESADLTLENRLVLDWPTLAAVVANADRERFGFIYDPGPGHVRLIRSMHSRHDIPTTDAFIDQLVALGTVAKANRRAQVELFGSVAT